MPQVVERAPAGADAAGPVMKREPVSKVDTAWLRMEQPTNLMMITGITGLSPDARYEKLLETVQQRFLAFRRFRQKAVLTPSGAFWELDEDFDIRGHVRRVALPGRADQQELEEYVSDLASTALDHSRPLWQFHYVENYVGGPVVVMRIHHCYADGIALVQVFLSLTDSSPEPRPAAMDPDRWKRQKARESSVFQRLLEPARDGADQAVHWASRLLEEATQIVQQPDKAREFVTELGELGREFLRTLLLPDDTPSLLKGKLGVRKRVAWADPLPLAEVKALSKALACTVNDLLIAAVAGAFRSYMLAEGEDLGAAAEIRATVPVNLRPLEHARELGNHFGLVFLPLPIGLANPLERVYRVNALMNELKAGKQATVAFGLLSVLGMGPAALQKPALEFLSNKATAVLTNVPGPAEPLFLAGGQVRDMMFWVPQTGNVGLGVSILSYDGQVFFGLIADHRLVPDPSRIIRRFRPELDKLMHLAMMLPLQGRPCSRSAEEFLYRAVAELGEGQ
jgi:diacylglycerol O-acyltransferase